MKKPNLTKKLLAAVSTVFIAVALSVVAVAAPASAHTATLSGSAVCNTSDGSATVTWKVINDYNELLNVSASNNAAIPVGTTVDATGGGASTSKTFVQTIPAPAGGVTATATLSFLWSGDNFTQNNTTATAKVSNDCKVPTPKDASAAVVDTPATCTSAETVVEGAITNATWGALDLTGNKWHAVATATSGHAFASGNGGALSLNNTVDTFSGNLPLHAALSPNSETCRIAAAAIVTTAPTCQAPETVTESTISFATWTAISYVTSGGVTTYTAVANATPGYTFPNASNVSNNNKTKTFTGTVAGNVTGHPCEDFIIVAWHMPSWAGPTTPTWSQTYFTSQELAAPDLSALDSKLVEQCGVQYQVDIYYNSPTTASLIAGQHLDGPNTPPEDLISGGWGTAYKLVKGPDCAPVTAPSESDVCTDGGTITIYAATGVKYYLNGNPVDTSAGNVVFTGLHGVQTVTATAASGYSLTGYPSGGWPYTINSDCTATYSSSGTCTSSDGNSQEAVTLNLVNTSATGATFVVTSTDSTVTPSGSYYVPANSTSHVVVGSVSDSGGTFNVSVNGAPAIVVKVGSFVGCVIVTPGDPSVTQATCHAVDNQPKLNNDASIKVDERTGLSYTITGPASYSSGPFTGNGGPTVVDTGLAPGDYVVTVVALPGYILDPAVASSWPFTINLAPTVCNFGVSVTPADCPPETIDGAAFTATSAGVPSIEVVLNPNLVYTAYKSGSAISVVLTAASTDVAPGTWTVKVTLAPVHDAAYDSLAGLTFGPFVLNAFCPPPLATFDAGVSSTGAVCTNGTTTNGVITLVHSAGQEGEITYKITNTATNAVIYNSSADNTVNVPAGSYSVTATPPPGDGISGNSQVHPDGSEIFDTLTIGLTSTNCDNTRLAFTGGTIAWFGFVLAGGMMFLGIAFLFMKRRKDRTAE